MNKNESRYFNTAIKMDQALLTLLEKKDFEYITIKEVCKEAKVNRSTFYLHYENIMDLVQETVEFMNKQFLGYFKQNDFIDKIQTSKIDELYLIDDHYLNPYLNYIKDNKKLFKITLAKTETLNLNKSYQQLYLHILDPIMNRYQINQKERKYIVAFYINGIMAIIKEWLKEDCKESQEEILELIKKCVKQP